MLHIPYPAWCEVCVRSKARGSPHTAALNEDTVRETPLVSMDFGMMDTEGEKAGEKATAFATTLILVENKSGYPLALSVRHCAW